MIAHMTAAQMAVKVGISERSIQRWIQEGRLQAKRIEDSALYEVETDDLDRLRLRGHREEETRLQAVERKVTEVVEHLDAATFRHEEQIAAMERQFNDLTGRVDRLEYNDPSTEVGHLAGLVDDLRSHVAQLEARHTEQVAGLSEALHLADAQVQVLTTRMEAIEQHVAATPTRQPRPTPTERKTTRPSPQTPPVTAKSTEGLVPAIGFARDHGIGEEAARTAMKPSRGKIETTPVEGQQARYLSEQQQRAALQYWRGKWHPCDDPQCPCHTLV
jgi:hypothetical protein